MRDTRSVNYYGRMAKQIRSRKAADAPVQFFFYMEMHLFFYIHFSASQSRPPGKSLRFPCLIIPLYSNQNGGNFGILHEA
jgi:hypothetical protein